MVASLWERVVQYPLWKNLWKSGGKWRFAQVLPQEGGSHVKAKSNLSLHGLSALFL